MIDESLVVHLTLSQFKNILQELKEEIIRSIPPPPIKFLTTKETTALLRITIPTLTSYVESGRIAEYKIGKRNLYKLHEVEAAAKVIKKYSHA